MAVKPPGALLAGWTVAPGGVDGAAFHGGEKGWSLRSDLEQRWPYVRESHRPKGAMGGSKNEWQQKRGHHFW
jgi:hypothetical protein